MTTDHQRLDDLEHKLTELRRWLPTATNRTPPSATHAWPSNTRPGTSGPANVTDDQGIPMPPLADPVGEAVARTVTTQAASHPDLQRARQLINDADAALGEALTLVYRHCPRIHDPEVHGDGNDQHPTGEPSCESCARLGHFEAVYRAGRCRWCYDFRIANDGVDPPATILEKRHRGERIYDADLKRARTVMRRRRRTRR